MTIQDAKKFVEKRDRLTKFVNTKGFKEFLTDGYFRDEAARLAQAITNPNMQDDIDQREIDGQFRAIGHLQNFILTIKQQGDAKEHAIQEHEQDERERLIREAQEEAGQIETDPITGEDIVKGED